MGGIKHEQKKNEQHFVKNVVPLQNHHILLYDTQNSFQSSSKNTSGCQAVYTYR